MTETGKPGGPVEPKPFRMSKVVIEGKEYPASPKLSFQANWLCVEVFGRPYEKLDEYTQFGVSAWVAMRSVVHNFGWDDFSSLAAEDVTMFDASGRSMEQYYDEVQAYEAIIGQKKVVESKK